MSKKYLATIKDYGYILEDLYKITNYTAVIVKLSNREKMHLAMYAALKCLATELKIFNSYVIELARNDDFLFYENLKSTISIRIHLEVIKYPNCSIKFLLKPDFNALIYNLYPYLTSVITKFYLEDMVYRLVTNISEGEKYLLFENIKKIHCWKEFEHQLKKAFALRDLLEILCGDEPINAFISKHFDSDLFAKFPRLVDFFLQGNEQSIADNLIGAPFATYPLISVSLDDLKRKNSADESLKNLACLFEMNRRRAYSDISSLSHEYRFFHSPSINTLPESKTKRCTLF